MHFPAPEKLRIRRLEISSEKVRASALGYFWGYKRFKRLRVSHNCNMTLREIWLRVSRNCNNVYGECSRVTESEVY